MSTIRVSFFLLKIRNGSYYQQNTVIGLRWNKKKKEISVYHDKKGLGTIFNGLDKKLVLFPSVDFCTSGASIELIKPKFK
jgi:hypothetical protein